MAKGASTLFVYRCGCLVWLLQNSPQASELSCSISHRRHLRMRGLPPHWGLGRLRTREGCGGAGLHLGDDALCCLPRGCVALHPSLTLRSRHQSAWGQLFPGFKGLGPQPSLFSVWPSGLDAPGEGGHLGGA